jgi:hypothetical protein
LSIYRRAFVEMHIKDKECTMEQSVKDEKAHYYAKPGAQKMRRTSP